MQKCNFVDVNSFNRQAILRHFFNLSINFISNFALIFLAIVIILLVINHDLVYHLVLIKILNILLLVSGRQDGLLLEILSVCVNHHHTVFIFWLRLLLHVWNHHRASQVTATTISAIVATVRVVSSLAIMVEVASAFFITLSFDLVVHNTIDDFRLSLIRLILLQVISDVNGCLVFALNICLPFLIDPADILISIDSFIGCPFRAIFSSVLTDNLHGRLWLLLLQLLLWTLWCLLLLLVWTLLLLPVGPLFVKNG